MKKILAILLLLAPCAASAEGLSGAYVGVNGGFATINAGTYVQKSANSLVGLGYASALVTSEQSSVNYKVFTGYNINKNFAVEAFYTSLGSYNMTAATTGPVRSATGTNKASAYGVDVLAKLPVAETNSVYLRVGYFQATYDTTLTGNLITGGNAALSSKSSNIKFGIGGDYGITENFSLRTDWEYYNNKDTPVNVLSLGLVANF